jgi:hypothetical protein
MHIRQAHRDANTFVNTGGHGYCDSDSLALTNVHSQSDTNGPCRDRWRDRGHSSRKFGRIRHVRNCLSQ